jgi:5-methylcytosine-specific restriction endonuclease McrA
MKNTITIAFLLFFMNSVTAQNTEKTKPPRYFSVQWLGWTYHPGGGSMPQNYPWKLDKRDVYPKSGHCGQLRLAMEKAVFLAGGGGLLW